MSTANLDLNATTYIKSFQAAVNVWSDRLSGTELQTLLFVIERTLRFNKPSEYIPIRHFLEGVQNRETGETLAGRIRCARSSIVKAYKSLVELGLLEIRNSLEERSGTNCFTVVVGRLLGGVMSHLKLSKKRQKAETPEVEGGHPEAQGGSLPSTPGGHSEAHHNIQSFNKPKVNNRQSTRPAVESTADAVAKAEEMSKAKRKAKASSTKATLATCSAAWRDAVAEFHPKTPVSNLTGKQYRRLSDAYRLSSYQGSLNDLVRWVVQDWDEIKANHLNWMTKPPMPSTPNADFIARHIERIIEYRGLQESVHKERERRQTDGERKARKASQQAEKEQKRAESLEAQLKRVEREREADRARLAEAGRTIKHLRETQVTGERYKNIEDAPKDDLEFDDIGDWK